MFCNLIQIIEFKRQTQFQFKIHICRSLQMILFIMFCILFLFRYKVRDEFKDDVQLIFSNCKRYNEDESPVGRAGHLMKLFFDSRWAELTTV